MYQCCIAPCKKTWMTIFASSLYTVNMYFFTPNTSHDLTCVSVLECINNNQPGIESLSSYTPRHLSTLCVSKTLKIKKVHRSSCKLFFFQKVSLLHPTLTLLLETLWNKYFLWQHNNIVTTYNSCFFVYSIFCQFLICRRNIYIHIVSYLDITYCNEEVFWPPMRGQPGHRAVRTIEVPGSRTWGRGAGA